MSQTFEKAKYNPKELSQADLEEIGENEQKALLASPSDPNTIWEEKTGKNGGSYLMAEGKKLRGAAIKFTSLLLVSKDAGFSHLTFGGQKFSIWENGNVSRSPLNAGSGGSGGGGSYRAAKPKYIQELFAGTVDDINTFLDNTKEENWELPNNPIVIDGKLVIARYKP